MDQLSLFFAEPALEAVFVLSPLAEAIKAAIEPPQPEPALRTPWPQLKQEMLSGLGGFSGKFDANLAALEVLRKLQSDPNVPSEAERVTLNRYTGWGGLPKAFQEGAYDIPLAARQMKLKRALSPVEWESARASTPNAHYTSTGVIEALWSTVERLGFKGGRILDPSAGTGYFLGAMPQALVERSKITAVELDVVSSDILKALYEPFGVKVHQAGFETLSLPAAAFDLAISNVPFGNYQVADTRKVPYANFPIHDWFIARMLEAVRPGGLVVAITTAGTLDKVSTAARMHFAIEAELLGAVRLPSMAFETIASTSVTTDVLIFQRRSVPVDVMPEWVAEPALVESSSPMIHPKHAFSPMHVNPWFARPQALSWMIGKLGMKSNGYGLANACLFDGDEPAMLTALNAALEQVQGSYTPAQRRVARKALTHVAAPSGTGVGSYVVTEAGCVAQMVGEGVAETQDGLPSTRIERIKGLIHVRDVALRLTAAQVTEDDSTVAAIRAELNAVYDAFVSRFGVIHQRANSLAFRADPAWPLLLSLELWDAETRIAEKADLFRVRTVGKPQPITHCDTPEEALLVCLAQEGVVVGSVIASLTGQPEHDVMSLLQDRGAIFRDPMLGFWVDRGRYLAGNIRDKISFAELGGDDFTSNADALRAVMPEPVGPGDIKVRLGATWVQSSDYVDFVKEVMGVEADVRYSVAGSCWSVTSISGRNTVSTTQTWGTSRVNGITLMEQSMNGQFPSVTDPDPKDDTGKRRVVNRPETLAAREKQESTKAAFVEWLWRCPLRSKRLSEVYNTTFNSFVPQHFDGSHLRLPGFSDIYTLRKHQLDGVWRILSSGVNTLLGHVVGAGKTLTSIAAGMEARRIGLAKKPCYVVPNHMLEQFAAEFLRAYPSARLLMAAKGDMAKENRKCFLSKVSTGDWDAVLMTHSTFERIPLSAESVCRSIKGIIHRIEQALVEKGAAGTVKSLEKAKKMWRARMEKMAAESRKDAVLTFEKLGVDMLFIDEAHLFKNLYRITRLRVPGVPTSDSQRAFDMWLKTRHVMESRDDGAGVVFMTATPISNSVAEMWTMQHYLQPATLEKMGAETFDAWAATFGEVVSALELAPDGSGYRMHERFARFVNVPELLRSFQEVADIKTRDMLSLPTPKVVHRIESIPSNPTLKNFVQSLVERSEKIKNGSIDPSKDNMLVVTSDGRKAALDLGLVGLCQPPGGKIDRCVENLLKVYQATTKVRGAQLVFCDLSTPSDGKSWSVYAEIRQKLGEAGLPADEVAFIHDYDSDVAKERLFQSVRDGRVRILLGSTIKMGVGMNVQTRLVALHHLDAPWRPSDVEQRDGRIDRQGNLNAEVDNFRYVTEGSFDAYMWQTLETKARFIAQVVSGNCTVRSVEDVEMSALSYAEVKALASGNPLVIEKATIDMELVKLSVLRSRWFNQRAQNRMRLSDLPQHIARREHSLSLVIADVSRLQGLAQQGVSIETKRGRIDRPEALGRLLELALEQVGRGSTYSVGKVCGMELIVRRSLSFSDRCVFELHGTEIHQAFDESRQGHTMVKRLQDFLLEGLPSDVQRQQASLVRMRAEQADLEALQNQAFEHEQRFIAVSARKGELDEVLCIAQGAIEVAEAA